MKKANESFILFGQQHWKQYAFVSNDNNGRGHQDVGIYLLILNNTSSVPCSTPKGEHSRRATPESRKIT